MNIVKIRNEMRNGRTIFDLPLRVTFYARVSTDRDEQLNSLENQVQYYTELIQSKRSWSYVPGYIDEGISGTSTKKRDSFLRMIQDAKDGRFDFIITKSASWPVSVSGRCTITMPLVCCHPLRSPKRGTGCMTIQRWRGCNSFCGFGSWNFL